MKIKLTLFQEYILIILGGMMLIAFMTYSVSAPPLGIVRVVLGLVYTFGMPGYMVQGALFPRRGDLEWIERLAFSFGVSLAVIPPMAMLLDVLPGLKIDWRGVLLLESVFIVIVGLFAYIQRGRLAEEERYCLHAELHLRQWWQEQSLSGRLIMVGLATAMGAAAFSAAVLISVPGPRTQFTDFYMLNSEGRAENYPRRAVVDRPVTVLLGIRNGSESTANYIVTVQVGAHILTRLEEIEVVPGETSTHRVSFSFSEEEIGDNVPVDFFLYVNEDPAVYRSLRLWMVVTNEE